MEVLREWKEESVLGMLWWAWSKGTSSNKLWLGLNEGLLKEATISAQRVPLCVEGAMMVFEPLTMGSKMMWLTGVQVVQGT